MRPLLGHLSFNAVMVANEEIMIRGLGEVTMATVSCLYGPMPTGL